MSSVNDLRENIQVLLINTIKNLSMNFQINATSRGTETICSQTINHYATNLILWLTNEDIYLTELQIILKSGKKFFFF